MAINGNVVGVPNPKTDWNQTDETKADYIKNKPDLTVFANAIKGTASGETVSITDISPIEHNMSVNVSGVEDLSSVKLYRGGKNLYKLDVDNLGTSTSYIGEGKILEKTENGVIVQGNVGSSVGTAQWWAGWFQPFSNGSTSNVYLRKGDKVTVSADITWLDITNYKVGEKFGCYLKKQNAEINNTNVYLNKTPTSEDIGITYRVKATHTIATSDGYYIPIFTLNSCTMKIENIQISFDSDVSYEPYKDVVIYDVQADGTVDGVKSIYPNTTLYTDTTGTNIDVEYNQDINAEIKNIRDDIPIFDSGTGETWELISQGTITEEVALLEISKDMQGNNFSLSKAELSIRTVGTETNTSDKTATIRVNKNTSVSQLLSISRVFRQSANNGCSAYIQSGHKFIWGIGGSSSGDAYKLNSQGYTAISTLYIQGGTFGIGSTWELWGVKK